MTRPLHTPPMEGQMYAKVENFGMHYDNGGTLTSHIDDANVITSMVKDNVTMHKVVIDLDLPAALIPSTTPGHFHLYIDHEIPAEAYWTLLRALAAAGLIELNYAEASIDQGRSAVRLPWVKKEAAPVPVAPIPSLVSETGIIPPYKFPSVEKFGKAGVVEREIASLARTMPDLNFDF